MRNHLSQNSALRPRLSLVLFGNVLFACLFSKGTENTRSSCNVSTAQGMLPLYLTVSVFIDPKFVMVCIFV